MAKIQEIKDNQDVLVYPLTHERAVYDSDGCRLDNKLSDLSIFVYADAELVQHYDNCYIKSNGDFLYEQNWASVDKYAVTGGHRYAFSGRMGATATLYFINWYDSVGGFISHESYRGQMDNPVHYYREEVKAPTNAAYMMMNVNNLYSSLYKFEEIVQRKSQEFYNEMGDKVDYVEKQASFTFLPGLVNKGTGEIQESSNYTHVSIELGNAKRVRFLGNVFSDTSNWLAGFSFYDNGGNAFPLQFMYSGGGTFTSELIICVPKGATTFKTSVAFNSVEYDIAKQNNFYCYLQYGNTVSELYNELSITKLNRIGTGTGYVTSDGTYTSSSYQHQFFQVREGDVLRFTNSGTTNPMPYAFVSSNLGKAGDSIPLAPGTQMGSIPSSGSIDVVVPNGVKLLTISNYSELKVFRLGRTDKLERSSEELGVDVQRLDESLDDVIEALVPSVNIDYNNYPSIKFTVEQVGTTEWIWHDSSSTGQTFRLVPIVPGMTITVNKTGDKNSTVYVLSGIGEDGEDAPIIPHQVDGQWLASYTINYPSSVDVEARGPKRVIIAADGAKYLAVYVGTSGDYAPDSIYLQNPISDFSVVDESAIQELVNVSASEKNRPEIIGFSKIPSEIQLDENGWQKPQTIQEYNAIQLANRMRFLKWTPKSTINGPWDSGTNAPRTYEGGVQQVHGVPYSSNLQDYKYVGTSVSIYSFLTAINNPYSLMYTEYTYSGHSQSIWGRKYNNGNGYCYYGTVCCGLTATTTGGKIIWNNPDFPRLSKQRNIYTQVAPTGKFVPEHLNIGDIYDSPTHSFMVYGIKRDSSGEITHIRIVEQTRGGNTDAARFYKYTVSNFKSSGISNFAHYKFNDFYNNIGYVPLLTDPTDIVLTNDNGSDTTKSTATQAALVYNNAICTFAGDKVEFKAGDLIVLNYNLTNDNNFQYSGIKLYKDGTLLNTYPFSDITQSELPEGQRNHALNLGNGLGKGLYYAVCYDDNSESEKTEFEILDDSLVSIQVSENKIVANMSKPFTIVGLSTKNEATETTEVSYTGILSYVPSYWELVDKNVELTKPIGYDMNDLYLVVTIEGTYGACRIAKKITNNP